MTSASRSPTTGGRPSSEANQSPKARKIAAYCRRVLAVAARAAIRWASPNRLHSPSGRGTGGGKGKGTPVDATVPALATSSASTSSSSSPALTAVSARCTRLTANAYSRNLASRVTLNRASDDSAPRNAGRGSRDQVRITELSDPSRCARASGLGGIPLATARSQARKRADGYAYQPREWHAQGSACRAAVLARVRSSCAAVSSRHRGGLRRLPCSLLVSRRRVARALWSVLQAAGRRRHARAISISLW
jgi:hypothetical protein